ncbi:putative polysaccharide biosynthesis protein [Paenibacillus glycinis]|uniref:Oligosaccharide flippase family protein n=1 Tax=Paenibacillus glycinis TaxID=2697035 RepID=A0ABW9XZE6_9BACL|nr:polysaccharide biosynthesis protein [Paenibacillus glycinis]NBD28080.1 oligosaccharide flippase family protein [Paenibacillus glycinis]
MPSESGHRSGRARNGGEAGAKGPRFMQGAALMGVAMLLSKTLGTLQKIPLQNLAGDRVFGIYNAVYPLYQLLLVMVTAGFPVAVSLLVAEREAAGDRDGSGRVLTASAWLLSAGGAIGFLLLWTGSHRIASWLGDEAATNAVKASALAFWVAPAMAAFRGYYQGLGRMLPSAVSQLSEQTVRVAGMLALLLAGWQLGWSDARLAAGATAGSAIGGLAGLAVIVAYWLREKRGPADAGHAPGLRDRRRQERFDEARAADAARAGRYSSAEKGTGRREPIPVPVLREFRDSSEPRGSRERIGRPGLRRSSGSPYSRKRRIEGRASLPALMRRLALLAVPVTLGALAIPVLNVVDAFTVPRLLQGNGLGQVEAMTLFGLYGRGQPLVQLVVMVAGAMGGALVPALAGSRARGDAAAVRQQASLVLRAAWGIGAAAALGLALLAEPINMLLYANDAGSRTFALVGCTALAGTVSALTAAVLQGLGAVRTPALLMLGAAVLKAAFNAALVPAYGTAGAACAGIAALTAAALLGSGAVRRAAGAAVPARSAAGMGLALAVMAAALVLAERGVAPLLGLALPPRAAAAVLALGGTALGGALFAAAALRFGGVSARELRALPGGDALAARLIRWRLLPEGA